MASVIDSAVTWAEQIAADDSHTYSQDVRWGPSYDCLSFVISAYTQAGVNVKGAGATYTGNMKTAFLNCGFSDVTSSVNLSSGSGLKKGDVLLNTVHHTALVRADGGAIVHASGKKNGICTRGYYNYPWNCVLRYSSASSDTYMYSENTYTDSSTEASVVWNNRVKENIQTNVQNAAELESAGELTLYANGNDITRIVGNLSWKNSIYELATSMSFETAKSDAKYLTDLIYVTQLGDVIQMMTNEEVFRGVVVKVDDGDKDCNKYTVYDLGWYLNKTSQTYQFKNITAGDAIKELCEDLTIAIDTMPELDVTINKIYFDKTVSAILTDLLDQCGGDYNYDFTPQGLRIYEIGTLVAYPEFRLASNLSEHYSPDYRGNVSHSLSIEEMKNSIKITSEEDSVYTELMVLQNRDLIDKYGFLQEIVKIDPDKENAETTAKEELADKGKIAETFSIEIIEKYDSYTRAGEVIVIDDVTYVIESTNHSFKDGWHFNATELKKLS